MTNCIKLSTVLLRYIFLAEIYVSSKNCCIAYYFCFLFLLHQIVMVNALNLTCVTNLPNFLHGSDNSYFTECGCTGLQLPPTLNISDANTFQAYWQGVVTFYTGVLQCTTSNPSLLLTNCRPLVSGTLDFACRLIESCCPIIKSSCEALTQLVLPGVTSFITVFLAQCAVPLSNLYNN